MQHMALDHTTSLVAVASLVVLVTFLIREYIAPILKGLKRVPEVLVWPYYGDTARVFADGERLSIERYERYGPVWSTWLLGKRTTFIGSLDLMKWCMTKEHDVLEADWPTSTRIMLGKGSLAASEGERHLQLRKLLKPAFSMSGIADMVPKVGAIAERCLGSWADAGQVQGMDAAKEFTFRVILELVFGMDPQRLTPEVLQRCSTAFNTFDEHLFSFPINLPGFGFRAGLQAREVLTDIIKDNMQHIWARQSRNGKSTDGRPASCAEQIFSEVDKGEMQMTDDDVADMFLNLLFAGHDTSAHTIARLLAELPRQPQVWERLVEEQATVVAEHGPAMDAAALKAMTYLDMVVREMLRVHPIVGGVFRKALKDFELPGGYHIPKGRQVFLSLGHALKYDDRWAGATGRLSPGSFCPERWASEEGQRTGAFLPFGSGLRMCVGYLLAHAEMKVFMAVLMRGYAYTPLDVNEPWSKFPLGGEPVNGLPLRFNRL